MVYRTRNRSRSRRGYGIKRRGFKSRKSWKRKASIPRPKHVIQRQLKFKGIRRKTNDKPEMKMTQYFFNGSFNIASGVHPVYIWGTNAVDVGDNPFMPELVPGVDAVGQFIGEKINMQYVDLRFNIRVRVANIQAQAEIPYDRIRLVLVRQRDPLNLCDMAFQDINDIISTKDYDIQYDKIINWCTGNSYNQQPLTALKQSVLTPARSYRFIIPMKMTMDLTNQPYEFPLQIGLMVLSEFNMLECYNVQARYHYRDP